jgi:uncharacterized cupin superfamily protein
MGGRTVKQIRSQLYTWSQYLPEAQLDQNGHFVQARAGEPGVLIDPVALHPGDEAQLAALGGVGGVLLTSAAEVREAARCSERFGCPLFLAQDDVAGAEQAGLPGSARLEPFDPYDRLPGGLRAIPLPDGRTPGETVFYQAQLGTAVAGAVIYGHPPGQLSLPPTGDHLPRAGGMTRGLRALLAHPVARLLLSTGQSLFQEAERALQDLVHRHDPAACLVHPHELQWQEPRTKGSRFQRRSAEYSRLLGLKVLDFELTAVAPGKQNTLVHRHYGAEEVFIVVEGHGEVETEHGTFPIGAGDVLGFPSRYAVAHAIRNTGQIELRFLSFSAPSEEVGLAEYPHSNKQLQWLGPGKLRRFYLPEQLDVDYWEGEAID